MKPIEFPNMAACVTDASEALSDDNPGPPEPAPYAALIKRLTAAKPKLPRLYRRTMQRPFLEAMDDLGEDDFNDLLKSDKDRTGEAGLVLDIAQGILQNAERTFEPDATRAFQEVVADLYDGFLSAEDRVKVKPPDRGVVAPLVKWGSPESGPYTWPADSTSEYGAMAGVVSLPPSHARRGLLSWSAIGHETGGHDVLHADDGLLDEIAGKVRAALVKAGLGAGLPDYWADRIDETASDVMGILNMGPAAAVGVIAYFRGFSKGRKLSCTGPANDEHPADIVRGWLGAEVVRLLAFKGREIWAAALTAETDADAAGREIRLAGHGVDPKVAMQSAAVVAKTIARARLDAIEGHALGDIQDWRDRDEAIVARLRPALRGRSKARGYRRVKGHYAAHVVAAAVYEGLRTPGADLEAIQDCMLIVLGKMLSAEPAWGPSFLARSGGHHRHVVHSPGGRLAAPRSRRSAKTAAGPRVGGGKKAG